MSERERFFEQIDALNHENFRETALSLFHYQYRHNPIYKKYVDLLGRDINAIRQLNQIPFLPISFFKTHQVISNKAVTGEPEALFKSSGTTTSSTSRHYLFNKQHYLTNCRRIFENTYGELSDCVILALLPAYLERENSSLVMMADYFIGQSSSDLSGFYLHDYESLIDQVNQLKMKNEAKQLVILGVSFALLDLAEKYKPDFSGCIVMETGGMKGRRAELTRTELHNILKEGLNVETIHSEYGMTELLSQSYSRGSGLFQPSDSMRLLIREVNDPFALSTTPVRAGGINVIDLANVDSCAFIETMDIGFIYENGAFEVLGRFDHSDVRGCNLMVV